jgi:WD40 repeat protein
MKVIRLHKCDGIRVLSFGPDGQTLAVLCYDGLYWLNLRRPIPKRVLWDAGGWDDGGEWPDPALSPDHRLLARSASDDRHRNAHLVLTDRSGKGGQTAMPLSWHYSSSSGLKLGEEPALQQADPRWLGWADEWDRDDVESDRSFSALQFSPDGRFLVGAVQQPGSHQTEGGLRSRARGVYRWDVAAAFRHREWTFIPPGPDILPAPGPVTCLAFSPDGGTLTAGLDDGAVSRWEFATGRRLSPLGPRPRTAAGRAGSRPRRSPGEAEPGPGVQRLAFSPDGATLAVAAGRLVTLFGTATARRRATLAHPNLVSGRFFHGPGTRPEGHSLPTGGLAFHPSGGWLATVCGDPSVRLWDVATGAAYRELRWDIGELDAVTFAPDGCLGAAGSRDGNIVIWDVDD